MGFNVNIDLKSILILIFLGASIIFFGMWFFKGSDTKDKLKELKSEIANIQHVRDSLMESNNLLKIDFDKKQKEVEDRDVKIKQTESELLKMKNQLNTATAKVKEYQAELAETKKKIDDLEKNPIKREGDDLINSLIEKLNN